jgi:hypothetical protein
MAHDEKAHWLSSKAERQGSGSAEHDETILAEPSFLQAIFYGLFSLICFWRGRPGVT